jgi:hypothetical protein
LLLLACTDKQIYARKTETRRKERDAEQAKAATFQPVLVTKNHKAAGKPRKQASGGTRTSR